MVDPWSNYRLTNAASTTAQWYTYGDATSTAASNLSYNSNTTSSLYWQFSYIPASSGIRYVPLGGYSAPAVLSEAQRAEAETRRRAEAEAARRDARERQVAYEARAQALERETAEAERKARDILLMHLTDEQREAYERRKAFRVVGGDGRLYEITAKRAHGVFLLDEHERRSVEFCITHPSMPVDDLLLAQKMLLETDPDRFRSIANATPLRAA